MKHKYLLHLFLLATLYMTAQVGIGTVAPNASLDIPASNIATPSSTDGILIPRMSAFPATDPTAAQNGMLVFHTGGGGITTGFYFWNASTTTWDSISNGGANAINDLTDGASDADGSNNGSSIYLGVNAGSSDDLSDNRNIGIGFNAGNLITTGTNNIALGYDALSANSTGFANTAIGTGALDSNNGNGNQAIGFHAMFSNTTGLDNIAMGFDAMYNNTEGSSNIGIGSQALRSNLTGDHNQAVGRYALQGNETGLFNAGMGSWALNQNVTGTANIAIGTLSLYEHESGDSNVAIGVDALRLNVNGTGNIAIGRAAGRSETGSNKLYIENSSSASPLIYGEFDTNLLRVNGTLDVNSAYQFPTADGSNGQVLTTDGGGNVSWGAGNNQIIAKLTLGSNYTPPNFSTAVLPTTGLSFNYGGGTHNAGTGTYTVATDGVYEISVNLATSFSGASVTEVPMGLRMYVNGGLSMNLFKQGGATVLTGYAHTFSFQDSFYLNAGDVLDFRVLTTFTGTGPTIRTSGTSFTIKKVY